MCACIIIKIINIIKIIKEACKIRLADIGVYKGLACWSLTDRNSVSMNVVEDAFTVGIDR